MHQTDIEFLLSREGQTLLDRLEGLADDSSSVQLISRLRGEGYSPEQVSAALSQAKLRSKAGTKFRSLDATATPIEPFEIPLLTAAGLEQATRWPVAARHAARYVDAGIQSVIDLGCGIGANSLAFARAGRTVTAVELDHITARVAAYNLASYPSARVITGNAEQADLSGVEGAFLDPARRTSGQSNTKRITDPNDYSPNLNFAFDLAEKLPTGIKLGPGLDRDLIPDNVEAQWVSVGGHVVEMGLWSGALARPNIGRSALVARPNRRADDGFDWHELNAKTDSADVDVRELGEYLYEPDGAVIRARLIGDLARSLGREAGAGMIDEHIAYLTTDASVDTPFAAGFRVREVLPFREKELKSALRARDIGTLEIKKRGIDVDPAQLRKKLSLKGKSSATLIIVRTDAGRMALLADRL
ncbi:THUMP-like domain-containing protein [Lysinibacter cavernae]|uniref:SAM-dependent methyltransferase n=1 Tax=Lysinibacter cavernae TaxID=1640652 RepID=A0A7X5R1I2_9MICO|nr:SAM-dependent methyltransferase [Lysinibacter cavernae]